MHIFNTYIACLA